MFNYCNLTLKLDNTFGYQNAKLLSEFSTFKYDASIKRNWLTNYSVIRINRCPFLILDWCKSNCGFALLNFAV